MNHKIFSKTIAVLCTACLFVSVFSGCALLGGQKPFETALEAYTAILASGNPEGLDKYTTENSYFNKNYATSPEEEKKAVLLVFYQMKITNISNASQFDNVIQADVTFCIPDYSKILETIKGDLTEKIKESIKSENKEQDAYQQDLISVLEKGFSDEQSDTMEKTVKLELKKQEHGWMINDDSQLFRGISNDFICQYTEMISLIAEETKQESDGVSAPSGGSDTPTGGSHFFNKTTNFKLIIGSQEVPLPIAIKDCKGITFNKQDLAFSLLGGCYDQFPIYINDEYAGIAYIYNPSGNTLKISQCLLGGISLNNTEENPGILLPNGITFGASPEEVQKAYGQPTRIRRTDDGDYFTYIYTYDYYQDVELIFSDGKSVTGYRIQFFQMD